MTTVPESDDTLRYLGGALILVVGAIHLQQYLDFINDVPTIGELFLLNAAGAGAIAVMLATRPRSLAALSGIALSAGALVSIVIALLSSLFDYSEPSLRFPIVLAIVAEAAAVVVLMAYLGRRRARSEDPGRPEAGPAPAGTRSG
ncbi:MAG: hypothetical protein ACR2IN_07430 [Thermoleophilaceae bacterium]